MRSSFALRASAVFDTFAFTFVTACSNNLGQEAKSTPVSTAQAAPSATPSSAAPAADQTYTTKRGDTVVSVARQFLSQSSLMTTSELEAAIRKANNLEAKATLKPGQTIVIPTLEKQPIVEKPVFVARDAEIRA